MSEQTLKAIERRASIAKTIKPYGFSYIKDGAFYYIVTVSLIQGVDDDFKVVNRYPWQNVGIGYTRKEQAVRCVNFLASYFRVHRVPSEVLVL